MSEAAPVVERPRVGKLGVFSWSMYDWANSPFTTVVTTFIIANYFSEAVAANNTVGAAQWGFMQGLAALAIALLSPVLGAIADRGGRRKPWLAFFTIVMVIGSAALWWGTPKGAAPGSQGAVDVVLWASAIGVVGFEVAIVFYNAMLPGLVPESRIGRISGWAWGLGYAGGLVCLIVLLFLFVQPATAPFGLDKSAAEHVRIAGPFVAVWTLVFCLPIFLFTPDTRGTGLPAGQAIREGVSELWQTIVSIRRYRSIFRFLIARLFYIDGLNTIFAVGAIYAGAVFGMQTAEVIVFGILLNVTAGLGAFGFGWLDDRIGAKPTIILALIGVLVFGIPMLVIESKLWFYILGAAIGLFFGPAQSASRSLMARLAPEGKENEMFGLYAFSGRSTAFLGPWLFALVTTFAGHRWGMATVMPFLAIGGLILLTVNTKQVDPDTIL
jgi:UMF1 family MFS transporter